MSKIWRWLKKNRYYVIGVVLVSATLLMGAVGIYASRSSENEPIPTEIVIIPTETQATTPTSVPTYTPSYTPVPTISCVICTPTATPTAQPLPFPPFTIVPPYNGSTATPPSTYMTCDVNLDGVANRSDMIMILWINVGLYQPTLQQMATVDLNGNGRFDRAECQHCLDIIEKVWFP